MKVTGKKKSKDKTSVAIEGDINIYSVKELKERFSEFFENVKNVELDLSAVDAVDTAGFQLLVAVRKELNSKDRILTIINPSNEITRIFSLYGEVF
jgi:anti-sigma B factor antagonist